MKISMSAQDGHPHLNIIDRALAATSARPRLTMFVVVGLCAVVGWTYFAAMVAQMAENVDPRVFGPGMSLLSGLFDAAPRVADHTAIHGNSGILAMPALGPWGPRDLGLVLLMWTMMACAMMMPTAAPMLSTYADIADTAAKGGKHAVSVVVLAAGYLVVWLGFAVVATLLQWGLTELRLMSPLMEPVAEVFAGTTMVAAGIYQFTPAKAACLTRCQRPFPYFFSRWTDRTAGVFRLGLEQGLFCLGCCWALMIVMFAVGVMNVVAIAVLTLIMAIEKTVPLRWVSHGVGVLFLAGGALILVFSEPGRTLCGF